MSSDVYNDKFQCFLSEYEWKNKLRFVRIYFDAPTFDRTTKDRAADPLQQLAGIGGVLGLITGFSFLSLVELVYHAVKIIGTPVVNKLEGLGCLTWLAEKKHLFIMILSVSIIISCGIIYVHNKL